uniref:Uncharacterized protein n=1 Tax=Arundo donax TaxID=35708 RepID=A0A0A9A0H6_ARUDO
MILRSSRFLNCFSFYCCLLDEPLHACRI